MYGNHTFDRCMYLFMMVQRSVIVLILLNRHLPLITYLRLLPHSNTSLHDRTFRITGPRTRTRLRQYPIRSPKTRKQ
jgi:hypothetical protein